MIFGVGIDLLDENRIKNIFEKYGTKFLDKILSEEEKVFLGGIASIDKKINFVAKRFSVKESLVKAVGVGMGRGLEFKNISVCNNEMGKPFFKFSGEAENFLNNFYKNNKENIKFNLSITDENNLINTIVIIGD